MKNIIQKKQQSTTLMSGLLIVAFILVTGASALAGELECYRLKNNATIGSGDTLCIEIPSDLGGYSLHLMRFVKVSTNGYIEVRRIDRRPLNEMKFSTEIPNKLVQAKLSKEELSLDDAGFATVEFKYSVDQTDIMLGGVPFVAGPKYAKVNADNGGVSPIGVDQLKRFADFFRENNN